MKSIMIKSNKYIVILDCKAYKNSYIIANKCNGFLQHRFNYFNIDIQTKKAYYALQSFGDVMSFYRNVTHMYPKVNYTYTIIKTGRSIIL